MSPRIEQALPKYIQVANHYRDLIVRGELRAGDELPSERQILREWAVSRATAIQALAILRAEGLVEARQGSGTFVRAHTRLTRRTRDRYAVAGEASPVQVTRIVLPDDIADILGLPTGGKGIRRRQVVRDDAGPLEIATGWFDGALATAAPRLSSATPLPQGPLSYLQQVTSRPARTARDLVGARLAADDEIKDLHLNAVPAAVLVLRHIPLDDHDHPLALIEAVFPSDRWVLEQEYNLPG